MRGTSPARRFIRCLNRPVCLLIIALPAAVASAQPATAPAATSLDGPSASQPAGRPAIVEFQPGIRINFKDRTVEVASTVILREGPLELFACTPQRREHESIVRIEARATHLFQALGLIGLTPGRGVHYDPRTESIVPPTGDPVKVTVAWEQDGKRSEEPIEAWMAQAGEGADIASPPDLPLVFAGSVLTPDGSIAADEEGTVIALVDFESALIAVAAQHSDSNEALWLKPRTSAIPPVGTRCTLRFQRGPLPVYLDGTGRVLLGIATVTMGELSRRLTTAKREEPGLQVVLRKSADAPASVERELVGLLKHLDLTVKTVSTQPASNPE